MQALFRFKVLRIGEGQLYRGNCIYLVSSVTGAYGDTGRSPCSLWLTVFFLAAVLCSASCLASTAAVCSPALRLDRCQGALQINHRSWADMLVDQYVTEGRAMFMSRWAALLLQADRSG
jgi:hypothetical protein